MENRIILTCIALELAEEYGIGPWVKALLDPAPVYVDEKKPINSPPPFTFTAGDRPSLPPPATPARGRGRPRASSPSKATPAGKLTSPRKRATKASKEANAAAARQASESLQAVADGTPSIAESESVDGEKVNGVGPEDKHVDEVVTVNVEKSVEVNGDIETVHTTVQVQMPVGSPDLPLPETTEEMIAKAKEMVEEAVKLDGESSKSAGKRKAEVLDTEDDEDETADKEIQPAKKAKIMEQEVKKQKVRTRALVGVIATAAIG